MKKWDSMTKMHIQNIKQQKHAAVKQNTKAWLS